MKRLFYEELTRVYDYSSRGEAKAHITKMESNGWRVEYCDNYNTAIFDNGQDDLCFSVKFVKMSGVGV